MQPLFDTGRVCKFRGFALIRLFGLEIPSKLPNCQRWDQQILAPEALERGLRLLHRADPSVSVEVWLPMLLDVIGHVLIHDHGG